MDSSRDSKKKLLRKAYIRTAFVCMVAKIASSVDYYNNAGINTLIMKI